MLEEGKGCVFVNKKIYVWFGGIVLYVMDFGLSM